MDIKTEIVESLPQTVKRSKYEDVISQARALEVGQALKVTSELKSHSLAFTVRQSLKRRQIADIQIKLRQKEVYLVKVATGAPEASEAPAQDE